MEKELCFEIIGTCPNQCVFCSSNSDISKKKIISLEDFKRTIDYFSSSATLKEVSLSGGEPFLHPDLFQMIAYITEKKSKAILFTSGVKRSTPLKEEEIAYIEKKKKSDLEEIQAHEPWNKRLLQNIENYYNKFLNPPPISSVSKEEFSCLKNLGLQKVVFDLQGYNEETDQYLMGRLKSFREAALDSILHASAVGLEVEVHFIPMKPNYKEITELLELLEIPKIPSIHILDFVPQGRGWDNKKNLELSKEEKKEFLEILEKGKKRFSGVIYLGTTLQKNTTHKCTAGLQKLHIKYDGTILPCAALKELSLEEYQNFRIPMSSIYDSLENITIPKDAVRDIPLCKKIYDRRKTNII